MEESEEISKLDSNELSFGAANANRKKSSSQHTKTPNKPSKSNSNNEEKKESGKSEGKDKKEILKEFDTL